MEAWEEPRRLTPSKRRVSARSVDNPTDSSEDEDGPRSQRMRGSTAGDEIAAAIRARAQAMERMSAVMREKVEMMQDQFGTDLFSLSESLFTTPQAKEYLELQRELELRRVRRLTRRTEVGATATCGFVIMEGGKNEYVRLRQELDLARIRKLNAEIEAAAAASPAPGMAYR